MTTITPLPEPPSRADPANFAERGDEFLGALPLFVTQTNAVAAEAEAAALTAINAPGTSATSTTSLTIGTGPQALTIQTGKALVTGQFVIIAYATDPANFMLGQITSYNSGTGALAVDVQSITGAGTQANWVIALAPAPLPGLDLLSKLLTVDGAGSGLDADLLDGQQGSYYTSIAARLGYTPANKAGETFTGPVATQGLTVYGNILLASASPSITLNTGGPRFFVQSANRLSVNNDSTTKERIGITSDGHLMLWGSRASGGAQDIPGSGNARFVPDGVGGVAASFYDTQGYTPCIFRRDSGGTPATVGSITSDLGGTSFNTSSDYRRKHITGPVTDALARVCDTPVWQFYFTDDPDQRVVDGFMAHEAAAAAPEAVHGEKDAVEAIGLASRQRVDASGAAIEGYFDEIADIPQADTPEGWTWTETGTRPVYQQIDQSKLVPVLWAALQELAARVETLEGGA